MRTTLLVRPDGTAIRRTSGQTGPGRPIVHQEVAFNWRYAGSGVWHGSMRNGVGYLMLNYLSIRYNGRELLYHEGGGGGHTDSVFVRADDQDAVDEHLRRRR